MRKNGKPVVDATEPLEITITAADTRNAQPKDPFGCAAAIAIQRNYDCLSAEVHASVTYVEERHRYIRYSTPQALARETVVLDRGGAFAPGDYVITVPSPTNRLGVSHNKHDTRDRHDQNSRRHPPHVTVDVRPPAPKGGRHK